MLSRILFNLRRQWLGASLGMLALFVAVGGATVFAHGGDSSQVHACVISGTGGSSPNVRIVGANEACPGGSTALDFAIQGPAGPAGPQGAKGDTGERGEAGPTPALLSSDPPSFRQLAGALNFSLKGLKVFKASTPTNNSRLKKRDTPSCPPPYSNFVTGGYETEGVPAERSDFYLLMNEALFIPGFDEYTWRVAAAYSGGPWKLTAYIVCKK